jgi:hypothetical protein
VLGEQEIARFLALLRLPTMIGTMCVSLGTACPLPSGAVAYQALKGRPVLGGKDRPQ